MPPKRGKKRKSTREPCSDEANHEEPLSLPDRTTWPGWVEMESEPAFFNVMLREMGVRGVKIQEVYGLDEEMLAILPRPIHAFIFLFRYRDTDQAEQQKASDYPEYIWFANQIPDFACASVALLNIVNNIKGLQISKELRDFRDFTSDMDPMSRGDAIDNFDFMKHIHNSFATETDLLIADMHAKQKAMRAKKKQALAKARQTREAKKTGALLLVEKSTNAASIPTRTSQRTPRKSSQPGPIPSNDSSPLSDPPDLSSEFETPKKPTTTKEKPPTTPRRSTRKPKPRQNLQPSTAEEDESDNEGFHFIAYMPIQGHVWKLDGLDSFPQDIGAIDEAAGGDWINIAQPALQTRMAMYEGADIDFNLMAVVHDPVVKDRAELAGNVKALETVEKKLSAVSHDWRARVGVMEDEGVLPGPSAALELSREDIDAVRDTLQSTDIFDGEVGLDQLLGIRKQVVAQQAPLRGAVRDAMEFAKADEERARHRRHDYGAFVRTWLGALAEEEALSDLLEDA